MQELFVYSIEFLYLNKNWKIKTKTRLPLQTHFLLLWSWPWSDDLDTQAWPRYSEDVPARQKWPRLSTVRTYRQTDRRTDSTEYISAPHSRAPLITLTWTLRLRGFPSLQKQIGTWSWPIVATGRACVHPVRVQWVDARVSCNIKRLQLSVLIAPCSRRPPVWAELAARAVCAGTDRSSPYGASDAKIISPAMQVRASKRWTVFTVFDR